LIQALNKTGDAEKLLIAGLKNVLPQGPAITISARVDGAEGIASGAAGGLPAQLGQLQLAIKLMGDTVNALAAALPKFLSQDQVAAINALVTNAEVTGGSVPSNNPAFFNVVGIGIKVLGNSIVAMAKDLAQ
jgi:hypothetical protein